MGKNNYFKLKQFTVYQDKSAMKVGTDGLLLGAWADIKQAEQILDIGTGTGLIALMMAQRSTAEITGIEIEQLAAEEARHNINLSPWNERIKILHQSFQKFSGSCESQFSLIVSNPPYFSDALKPVALKRNLARHNDSLPFRDLLAGAKKMLTDNGKLALILPADAGEKFIETAQGLNFHLTRITKVYPFGNKPAKRFLMEFSKTNSKLRESELIIYESNKEYSEEYKTLLKDFYLAF